MSLTAETLRLERQLRALVGRIVDQQTRDLVAMWVKAWDEVSGDLRDALEALIEDAEDGQVSRALMLRNRRLQKALAVIAEHLAALVKGSQIRVTSDLQAVVDQAGLAQAAIIASTLPTGQDLVDLEAWSRVDRHAIAAIVRRATQQITVQHKPLSAQAYDVLRRELIRGVAAGQNPRSTADRIVRRAEHGFNGGLTRALVIARTETLDAHREAARIGQDQHADVLAGWVWLASLSPRTCRSCLAMHGQLFSLDQPGPYDHQQGRCSRMPKTRTWASLGFDDVAEPADSTPSAEEFFRSLTRAEQVAILGPKGWEAWSQGRWPIDLWSRRKKTDGWRDSHVAALPPR